MSLTKERSSISGSSQTNGSDTSQQSDSVKSFRVEDQFADIDGKIIDGAVRAEAERIKYILHEVIDKVKLVVALPALITDYNYLSSILSPKHLESLLAIFEQSGDRQDLRASFKMLKIEDIEQGRATLKKHLSPLMARLLYILLEYEDLKPMVDVIVRRRDQGGAKFLTALEDIAEDLMKLISTPASTLVRQMLFHQQLKVSNEKTFQTICELENSLEIEKEKFATKMKQKMDAIESLKKEIYFLVAHDESAIVQMLTETDRNIATTAIEQESKLASMRIMLEQYEEERKATSEINLKIEDESRAKRIKTEIKLKELVALYDEDMNKRQDILEDITEKYKAEKGRVDKLEEKMKILDEEYQPLMAEREAEYQEELTNKMNEFLEIRAAKVIQRAWRAVLANKKTRKVHSKSKGKKKKKRQT